MLKLPGTGETLYQQLVAALAEGEPRSDGTRRALYNCIRTFGGDTTVCHQVVDTANQALVENTRHPLHGWTVRYDGTGMYFVATPPAA